MSEFKQLLIEIGVPERTVDGVRPQTRIRADLGLSSSQTTELEIQLRERFGMTLNLWDREDYTVGQLADRIPEPRG
ncbi:acyl carrier protein [Nocardia sp. AG03]|uniref:acyl carrier protein n=1 Tax=Nocardia sp. AG03 TaxID=3025312 RepID=UPI00241879F3|nr:acyl carrier protein [Nocardia sp. AG03]